MQAQQEIFLALLGTPNVVGSVKLLSRNPIALKSKIVTTIWVQVDRNTKRPNILVEYGHA